MIVINKRTKIASTLYLIPDPMIGFVPEVTMVFNLSGFGGFVAHLIGRVLFFSREGNAAFVAQGA